MHGRTYNIYASDGAHSGLKGYDFSSALDINNERINDREIIVSTGADLERGQRPRILLCCWRAHTLLCSKVVKRVPIVL